jgi:hypothetical protein
MIVVLFHHLDCIVERLVRVNGDEWRRHDRYRGQFRRVPALRYGAAGDVAVGNDPDDVSRADDWNCGAIMVEHQHGHQTKRRRRLTGDRIVSHGVSYEHGSSPHVSRQLRPQPAAMPQQETRDAVMFLHAAGLFRTYS